MGDDRWQDTRRTLADLSVSFPHLALVSPFAFFVHDAIKQTLKPKCLSSLVMNKDKDFEIFRDEQQKEDTKSDSCSKNSMD